ncbi:MAG TPA: VOC family protein [Polyangia bacterium]|nr:VOC family protein [Polyangia bacterium]
MPARIFRIILEVGDLDRATEFYSRLLGAEGRPVGGGRVYFDCGPMILALLKPEGTPTPIPEYLYFAVDDLEAFHARAKDLDALSKKSVHGESAAEIVVRPWHERSFYAFDPWGNGLCFVDDKTLFIGRR